jgi:hypothetical protein
MKLNEKQILEFKSPWGKMKMAVRVEQYRDNDTICLDLYEVKRGVPTEQYTTATVNMPMYFNGNRLHCFVKNYSENEGCLDFILNNKLGIKTYSANSGFVQFDMVEFDYDRLLEVVVNPEDLKKWFNFDSMLESDEEIMANDINKFSVKDFVEGELINGKHNIENDFFSFVGLNSEQVSAFKGIFSGLSLGYRTNFDDSMVGLDWYLEIESWTNGGVDMVETLELADHDYNLINCLEALYKEWSDNDFIDAEIDTYRQDQNYKNNFSLRASLDDFESYRDMLGNLISNLNALHQNEVER